MYRLSVQRFDGDMYVDDEELAKILHKSLDFVDGMIQVLDTPSVLTALCKPNAKIMAIPGRNKITCEPVTIHRLNKEACIGFLKLLPDTENLQQSYAKMFDALEKSDGKQWEYIFGELDANNRLIKSNLVGYPMGWGDDPAPVAKDDGWTTKLTPDQVLKEI